MALKDTGKNINVNGVTHSVFYDKDTGAVEVRTEQTGGQGGIKTGGDAVYNSNTGAIEGYNQTQIEATISISQDIRFLTQSPMFLLPSTYLYFCSNNFLSSILDTH